MKRRSLALALVLPVVACTAHGEPRTEPAAQPTTTSAAPTRTEAVAEGSVARPVSAAPERAPNEMGRIPVLMYHVIGEHEAAWTRTPQNFRADLELLYARGYRPVNMVDVLDRKIDQYVPRGYSPVVFTFDDASPEQFSYIEQPDGSLKIDPNSAVGIWLAFHEKHPDWSNRAVFCMLPAAGAGHAFFGEKGIKGQKTAWRYQKVRFLAEQGFELCNHTLWHAQLSKYPDAFVQEQIARGQMAIDSAVPGYRVRSFALPQGLWPKNRPLAWAGSWTDPKTGRTVSYRYDAVFEVWGHADPSPYDPKFNGHSIQRLQVTGNALARELDVLDRPGERYVSDGDPRTVARPATAVTMRP